MVLSIAHDEDKGLNLSIRKNVNARLKNNPSIMFVLYHKVNNVSKDSYSYLDAIPAKRGIMFELFATCPCKS
jgi:ribosomal protein S12